MITLNVVLPHLGGLARELVLLAPKGRDEIEVRSFDRGCSLVARGSLTRSGFRCTPVAPDAPYAFRVVGRRADA